MRRQVFPTAPSPTTTHCKINQIFGGDDKVQEVSVNKTRIEAIKLRTPSLTWRNEGSLQIGKNVQAPRLEIRMELVTAIES